MKSLISPFSSHLLNERITLSALHCVKLFKQVVPSLNKNRVPSQLGSENPKTQSVESNKIDETSLLTFVGTLVHPSRPIRSVAEVPVKFAF